MADRTPQALSAEGIIDRGWHEALLTDLPDKGDRLKLRKHDEALRAEVELLHRRVAEARDTARGAMEAAQADRARADRLAAALKFYAALRDNGHVAREAPRRDAAVSRAHDRELAEAAREYLAELRNANSGSLNTYELVAAALRLQRALQAWDDAEFAGGEALVVEAEEPSRAEQYDEMAKENWRRGDVGAAQADERHADRLRRAEEPPA